MTTDFGVLGPLQVRHGGAHIAIGAPMVRRLLAVLLCRPGRAVAVPTLIEALWGEAPPPSSRKTVQVYVRRLRQLTGEQGRIAYGPGGYALVVTPGELDALRFAELTGDARAAVERGSLEAARALFRQGSPSGAAPRSPTSRSRCWSPPRRGGWRRSNCASTRTAPPSHSPSACTTRCRPSSPRWPRSTRTVNGSAPF